mmetsp:Transcript_25992/g.70341  ORF Transcript_25992/g.70341 Transcript_25992/m.70341 type:complete len:416 (+) Transcript_25992:63-1310(+)|eukprot:CAMPEP_0185155604 /NCGR_PEP_ID=MMETSP1139-20130426/556_1 /TAXON_ID=298111 /ORGANISM="Pavlova sp., Strain CCMP459" /LENGTH=415 /DNA_ID=CAMNT_0027720517 /DNA_START=59 /DNA_END=1306 /DNA_ORIENTATION=-
MGSGQSQEAVNEAHRSGIIIAVADDLPEGNEDEDVNPPTPSNDLSAKAEGDLATSVRADYFDNAPKTTEPVDLPFKLGRTLGTGAFGKVKLASHNRTGARLAVKIVPREKLQDKRLQDNMAREIKMMKLLRNDHIVRLYDVVVARTKIYLAMEYADGGDMLAYVNSRKPMSESEAAAIFSQVLDGVSFCHKLGVCHRDLKLENLLLCNGVVKIADFGLANYAPAPASVGAGSFMETHCGSPLYAAPELLRNTEAYDATKVDVWSLGVVLFALVTKKLPFEGENLPAILRKIVAGDYIIPEKLSPECADLLRKMLTVDPAERMSVEEAEQHAWVSKHAPDPAQEAGIERSVSHEDMVADDLSALTIGQKDSAGSGSTAASGETKRRPMTLPTEDLKAQLAPVRAELQREKDSATRA